MVKAGYKLTEVGVIPIDWEVKKLNEVTNITRLAGYEYSTVWEETENGEIIALRGFNIGKNKIIEREMVRISNKLSMRLIRSRLFKGDIVYPCVGTIGNAVVIEEDDKYHIQQNIAKITPLKNSINSYFLAHYLMSNFGLREIEKFNGSSSQPNILVGSLRKYSIIHPSKAEQTAIATALTEADALISGIEKLIAKKRDIKQGTMQKLLSPTEGWEVKKIQDLIDENIILSHLDGNHGELYPRSNEFKESGVPYVGANDFKDGFVDFNNCKFLSLNRANLFKKGIAKNGDILFAHNATVGPVAILKTVMDFVILSTTATYFRCDNLKLINLFLFYSLQAPYFISQFHAVMLQSTRAQVPIGQQRKFSIVLPNPLEQTRIATILSDMDTEIAVLEKKLEKYRAVKAGMMQNLLTGKIRLV